MRRALKNLNYWFDYVVGYVMTNPKKLKRYHKYMRETYGDKYCTQDDFDRYWEQDGIY